MKKETFWVFEGMISCVKALHDVDKFLFSILDVKDIIAMCLSELYEQVS